MPFIPPFEQVAAPPVPATWVGAGLVSGSADIGPVFETEAPPPGNNLLGIILLGFVVGCGAPPGPGPVTDQPR